MNQPEQKLPRRDKRHVRLRKDELEALRKFQLLQNKPKINTDLPYSDPFIMTPRNKK